jgi:hypothetical protein
LPRRYTSATLTASKRIYRVPYFHELFIAANLLAIHLMFRRDGNAVLTTVPTTLLSVGVALTLQAIGGVIVRLIVAAGAGNARAYLRIIRSPGWLTDTLRLILAGVVMTHVYGWIKVTVPLFHARRFDQELWNLDRALFFGHSPNVLFLDLFANRRVLAAVDWSYAMVFIWSMTIAFGFFLSAPSRRLRIAFTNGNTWLWITGAWLYLLVPSLGPAYGFPEIWFAYSESLGRTQALQALLLKNYQNVLTLRTTGGEVSILFGIAAFPSLHVAFQTYVLLWMRKLWTYGQIVFGVFVLVIFLGSIITGWHYLVDGLAGMLLAALAYWMASRVFRTRAWLRIRG